MSRMCSEHVCTSISRHVILDILANSWGGNHGFPPPSCADARRGTLSGTPLMPPLYCISWSLPKYFDLSSEITNSEEKFPTKKI